MSGKFIACLSGAAIALASASGASAQSSSASAASGLELEEVVVTAERVTKNLQKVSQVITAYDGAQLKKEGKIRIDEILQGITGVQLQSDQVDTNIYMRGLSTGVPLLVDGINQGAGPAVRSTTLDIAQVSVARGVQNGAGTTSLTGAVNLVTNKPVFEYQASGSLTVGSYNLRNTEGVVNLPLSDNQAVRVAYSSDRRNGYMSSDAGNSDNRQFRVRYRWKPSDNLDITASFQEDRTEGNGVSASTLLYTGHWINITNAESFAWTNPYTGATSVWGQTQPVANQLFASGTVNANGVAVAGNQYGYPAGPCSVLTSATTTGAATLSLAARLAATAPVITTMGCPVRQLAIRDGVYFGDRSNPWDDGFQPYAWSNSPVRNTIQRQANVTIDWSTPIGQLTIQPAYVYSLNNFVEPARGTSWMVQGGIPSKSERLDVQLVSKPDSKLSWTAGLNGSHTPRAKNGITFTTIGMPVTGWTTGTAGMAAASNLFGSSCYFVTPTGVATAAGIQNTTQCLSSNYSVGSESYNYGLSLQGTYPILDNLRLNGSVRKDWYAAESRGGLANATLIDGQGQRYYWYLPATTYCSGITTGANPCAATNPNGLFQVPYRVNISQADINAMVDSFTVMRKNSTESFTFNVEYDFLPDAMVYAKFATGATGAMAAGMGGATGGTINVALPDARYTAVGGNATPAAVALNGTPYVVGVNLPSPLVKGEETKQLSVGLKSQWFDRRLQVNMEAFDNHYSNRALSALIGSLYSYGNVTGATPVTSATCTASASNPIAAVLGTSLADSCFATNVGSYTGDMISRGIDLDVSYVPTPNDRVDLSVEYLRTVFDGVPAIGTLSADSLLAITGSGEAGRPMAQTFADNYNNFLGNIAGQTLQNAPRFSVNLNYQHQFDLPGGSRLTPRLTGYYKSAAYFNESLQNGSNSNITDSNWAIKNGRWLPSVQPAYSLFDFYTTWQSADAKWSLSGYVKNIENEPILSSTGGLTTITSGSVATNDLTAVVTGGYANLNAPRTIGLTLSTNF